MFVSPSESRSMSAFAAASAPSCALALALALASCASAAKMAGVGGAGSTSLASFQRLKACWNSTGSPPSQTLVTFVHVGRPQSPTYLCGRQGRCGRPARTYLPIGRGWPRLEAALSLIWRSRANWPKPLDGRFAPSDVLHAAQHALAPLGGRDALAHPHEDLAYIQMYCASK
eukprot:scaffold48583_cov66-Phaeocystis_antarctica.AAC.2